MKTSSKILVAALFGAALSLGALAGPGIQSWQNAAAAKPADVAVAAVAKPADAANGVKCMTMIDGTVRASREITTPKVVTCTPEMMQNNPRCQQACAGL